MKDLIITGAGNSRTLKSNIGDISWDDAKTLLQAGTFPIDLMGLSGNGVSQVGTPLNKASLLDDTTKAALELTQSDPTINNALYALSQKGSPAEVHVMADSGTTVTMTKGDKTLTATAASDGYAILYPTTLGDWTVSFTYGGTVKSKTFSVNVIGILYCYPFVYGGSLEATAWDDIGIISNLGLASQYFAVGDKKSVALNGTTYYAQIIDFDHDTLTTAVSGRTKAGITFQLENCFTTTYYMNSSNTNSGGWTSSYMRGTVMPLMKGYMPTALKNALKKVNKLTSAGSQSSTINTSSDDLFLLSEIEVFGTTTYSFAGEGSQYGYYSAGNSKIKKVNGSAYHWWERSPYSSNATDFCRVNSSGGANYSNASNACGVAFGFCI
jgi:hypothetical protein